MMGFLSSDRYPWRAQLIHLIVVISFFPKLLLSLTVLLCRALFEHTVPLMAESEQKREEGRSDDEDLRDGMNVDEPKVPSCPGLLHEVELTMIFLRAKRK